MIARIIKDAGKLIKELGSRDPRGLAAYFDVSLREDALGSLKAYIFFQSRVAVICLNSSLPEELRPLLICHEMGHYLYHQKLAKGHTFQEKQLFSLQCSSEYEANLFAAEFLLEDGEVWEKLKAGGDLFCVASEMGVPPELLDFKLKLMHYKGYEVRSCLQAAGDFLK